MNLKFQIATIFSLLISSLCFGQLSENIRLNQVGFYTNADKKAVLVDNANARKFEVRTVEDNKTVYAGSLKSSGYWKESGENCHIADFSKFNAEGNYILYIKGEGESHPFTISRNVFAEANRKAWRYFYYHRNSSAIVEPFAEGWARESGHPDTNVQVDSSCNSSLKVISSPKGWYDAGDYGKYTLTATISTYTLLSALEQFPETAYSMNLNIPESSNDLPDVIDEILWELEWMQTMQDPNDGGGFHKLTTKNFAGAIMPKDANADRFVCGKNTNSALGLAATFAAAYRILEPYDSQLGSLRGELLSQAIKAWNWSIDNPEVSAEQCPGFVTGAYTDKDISDEWAWAAAEMYLATGVNAYYESQRENIISNSFYESSWGGPNGVRALATISLVVNQDKLEGVAKKDFKKVRKNLKNTADEFKKTATKSPYRTAMGRSTDDFVWGSNGSVGNQSFLLLTAYNHFGNKKYLNAALSNVDYILGRNATAYCMFSGMGGRQIMDPHDRISYSDGKKYPLPGMVAGGPQAGNNPDPCTYASEFPAKKFIDDWCSYSTNEITVNWNAPFAFSLIGLESILGSR